MFAHRQGGLCTVVGPSWSDMISLLISFSLPVGCWTSGPVQETRSRAVLWERRTEKSQPAHREDSVLLSTTGAQLADIWPHTLPPFLLVPYFSHIFIQKLCTCLRWSKLVNTPHCSNVIWYAYQVLLLWYVCNIVIHIYPITMSQYMDRWLQWVYVWEKEQWLTERWWNIRGSYEKKAVKNTVLPVGALHCGSMWERDKRLVGWHS